MKVARSLKNEAKKYIEIMRMSMYELFASPMNFYGRLLVHALRITTLGIVYTFVYQVSGKSEVQGTTSVDIVWSLALVQLVYQSSRSTFEMMKDEILSGQIETRMNKPYSFIAAAFFEAVGQSPLKFLSFTAVTVFVLGLFFGFPSLEIWQIAGSAVLYILGVCLYVLLLEIIGLTAFWLENPDPVYWIVSKLSWVFNGTFVPLVLLPPFFRIAADFFPVSAPFYIGRIFEVSTYWDLMRLILLQVGWLFVYIGVARVLYRRGIRKVSIHGG